MTKRIFVAGHKGMVGSALVRRLQATDAELVTVNKEDLDLRDQQKVIDFLSDTRIDEIYLAAARVGGIQANSAHPASFLYDNLMIQANVIQAAHLCDVNRLLFLGSSCIYPRDAPQPMTEDRLLTGPLEKTSEAYAIAKIAGIKLCESYYREYGRDYRAVMPASVYGPFDNFNPGQSHVMAALIRKFHEAVKNGESSVEVWGSGKPLREFMYVDDLTEALVFIMAATEDDYRRHAEPGYQHINIGTGIECSIRQLAETIAEVVGFSGDIVFDATKPDGVLRKLVESSRILAMGWQPTKSLADGIAETCRWFSQNGDKDRCI